MYQPQAEKDLIMLCHWWKIAHMLLWMIMQPFLSFCAGEGARGAAPQLCQAGGCRQQSLCCESSEIPLPEESEKSRFKNRQSSWFPLLMTWWFTQDKAFQLWRAPLLGEAFFGIHCFEWKWEIRLNPLLMRQFLLCLAPFFIFFSPFSHPPPQPSNSSVTNSPLPGEIDLWLLIYLLKRWLPPPLPYLLWLGNVEVKWSHSLMSC